MIDGDRVDWRDREKRDDNQDFIFAGCSSSKIITVCTDDEQNGDDDNPNDATTLF